MGSIDIVKPLPTVLSSAVNKSQEHNDKKILVMPRIECGAAGLEASMLPLCYAGPLPPEVYSSSLTCFCCRVCSVHFLVRLTFPNRLLMSFKPEVMTYSSKVAAASADGTIVVWSLGLPDIRAYK